MGGGSAAESRATSIPCNYKEGAIAEGRGWTVKKARETRGNEKKHEKANKHVWQRRENKGGEGLGWLDREDAVVVKSHGGGQRGK